MMPILDERIISKLKEVDEDLYMVFNPRVQRLEIHDKRPKGPETMVMRIQNPDGSFRQFDDRTMETLRRGRVENIDTIIKELEAQDELIEKRWHSKVDSMTKGLADDIKFAGKVVIQGGIPGGE